LNISSYQVWEDWEKNKYKSPVYYLMVNDKHDASGWRQLGIFTDQKHAERLKRVAEQCGEIHARAMIRLLN